MKPLPNALMAGTALLVTAAVCLPLWLSRADTHTDVISPENAPISHPGSSAASPASPVLDPKAVLFRPTGFPVVFLPLGVNLQTVPEAPESWVRLGAIVRKWSTAARPGSSLTREMLRQQVEERTVQPEICATCAMVEARRRSGSTTSTGG